MIGRHPCSFVAFSVILSLLLLHVMLCRLDIETRPFCAAALGFIREIHWHLSCGNLGVKPYALQLLLRQHGRKVPQLSSPKERQVAFRSEANVSEDRSKCFPKCSIRYRNCAQHDVKRVCFLLRGTSLVRINIKSRAHRTRLRVYMLSLQQSCHASSKSVSTWNSSCHFMSPTWLAGHI